MNPVLKLVLTGLTIGAAVIAAIVFVPVRWFEPVVALLASLACLEYAMLLRLKTDVSVLVRVFIFLIGAAVILFGLSAIPGIALSQTVEGTRHGNLMLLYILAIVKFSDVGGFAFGLSSAKLLKGGNHKLCPTISPGKSWEGLLGSVVFSCAVSCAFVPLTKFGVPKALAFGLVAALVGTAGDLVESKFKRWVGVKDSSALKITNGMGGFLDMFDSILFLPALVFPVELYLYWVKDWVK